jgi:hypothetical protein
MTVTSVGSGTLAVGQTLTGSGVTANTMITGLGTGTGGMGTYYVDFTQTVGSEAITAAATAVTVTYGSQLGAFIITSGAVGPTSTVAFPTTSATATALGLTQAAGATLSQGAAPAQPAAFMNALILVNQDWVTFQTLFDPDGGSGNAQKQLFAQWKNTQNNRFAYLCWDNDVTPTESVPATSSLGYILANDNDSGTALLWTPDNVTGPELAAFVGGAAASIDFTETNGRITFAYKAQAGLTATVMDPTTANNLAGSPQTSSFGNGYNFYGAYASANQGFTWFQRGTVTGPYQWLDSYINQIWLNNAFQLALLEFLGTVKSIPYTAAGNSLIEQVLADPIAAGLNFGAFAPGTISAAQAAEVNAAAGTNIAATLQTQGWYLQILPAISAVRAARGSPPMTFWYLDRGSVQAMNLASVAVQ